MVNIFDDLAGVGFPVYQQGTAPEHLPDSFLTVWEDYSSDLSHGDNKPQQLEQGWTLIFYTKDKNEIYNGLNAAIKHLKTKGYKINGRGSDYSGTWEGYEARVVDVVKITDLEV